MKHLRALVILAAALLFAGVPSFAQYAPIGGDAITRGLGRFVASQYNYGGNQTYVVNGNSATGSQSITLQVGEIILPDGRIIFPFNLFSPIIVGNGSAQELVTPTAVSNCVSFSQQVGACTVTASFANTHGNGEPVLSGSAGLAEANYEASLVGGGVVVADAQWAASVITGCTGCYTSANNALQSVIVFNNTAIEDTRNGPDRWWSPTPTGAALAVPTTLTAQAACDATHTFCSDANVAGSASYAGGTLFGCVAYVDIMGNEGPCSLTASFTDVSAKAIDVGAPAASAGAVGYVVYLSLDAGTYAQAYQIPSTALNCTLTTLETTTPACAVTNATYGQTGSTFGKNALFSGGSQITTYPVNTGLHFTQLASTAMTAASLTPVSNSSVTYTYAPSNRVGGCGGISSANVIKYAAAGSSATTIPNAIATWTVPAGCFNFIGAEFRVSGKFTFTDGGDTSTKVLVAWDAAGTNTTTVPTTLCSVVDTATGTAAAYNGTYYCSVKVATIGATGTALVDGYANLKLAAGATTLVRDSTDIAVAPSASINLTAPGRIVVYFIGTGNTNNPGAQGLAAKLEVLN